MLLVATVNIQFFTADDTTPPPPPPPLMSQSQVPYTHEVSSAYSTVLDYLAKEGVRKTLAKKTSTPPPRESQQAPLKRVTSRKKPTVATFDLSGREVSSSSSSSREGTSNVQFSQ